MLTSEIYISWWVLKRGFKKQFEEYQISFSEYLIKRAGGFLKTAVVRKLNFPFLHFLDEKHSIQRCRPDLVIEEVSLPLSRPHNLRVFNLGKLSG